MVDALSYDKKQGFTKAEVAFIQRRVGTNPDGRWGPDTVTAIEAWQGAHGIPADGKVWRSLQGNTWPQLLNAGATAWAPGDPGISRVGLWTFSNVLAPGSTANRNTLATAQAAALTDVIFTITKATVQSFQPPHGVDDAVAAGTPFKDAGFDLSLNSFVFPSEAYVDALADYALAFHRQLGLRRLDLDAEELWTKHGNAATRQRAATRLGERLADVDFEVAVNGIVYANRTALDPLVKLDCVTHITPQAYSTAGYPTKAGHNPIDMQAAAAGMWGGWWPDKTMIGGFATYRQAGAYELGELDEALALGLALRSWADAGVSEVAGWSSASVSDAVAATLRGR